MVAVIAFLILLGLVLLLLEFVIIPGSTIVGAMGFLFTGIGVYITYSSYGLFTGHVVLGITVTIAAVAFYYSLTSKAWQKLALKDKNKGKAVNQHSELLIVGMQGIAISPIKPMGKAEIEGHTYEVEVIADYIDEGTTVIVKRINGNNIEIARS